MRHTWVRWLFAGMGIIAVLSLGIGAFWAGHAAAQVYAGASSGWYGGGLMGLFFLPLVFLPILVAVIALRHEETESKEE